MLKNLILIFILVLVITLPFINKPFHLDDPWFIFSARAINNNFMLPYSYYFPYRFFEPISGFIGNVNPPLYGYFIAPIIKVFGESHTILHLFLILSALFAAFSIYLLSRYFVKNSILVTLLCCLNPLFMIYSHSIMPDTTLLAFWVFSVYLFIKGFEENNFKILVLSGIFIGFTEMIRYSGLFLIPILLFFAVIRSKRLFDKKQLVLLIPIMVFGLFCIHNIIFYGNLHILAALKTADIYTRIYRFVPVFILNTIYIGSLMFFPACFTLVYVIKSRRYIILSIFIIIFIISQIYLSLYKYSFINITLYSIFLSTAVMFYFWIIIRFIKKVNFHNIGEFLKNYSHDLFLLFWVIVLMIFHSSMYYTAPKYLLMNLVPVALLLFRLLESKHKDLIRYTGPIIIVSFMLGMLLSFSDYARAYIDTYKTVETLENLSNKYHQNVWISDENRGEFYYIPNKFNICSNDKVVHEFQAGDLILGTPWFYKDDIYAKGLIAKPLEGIFYTIPIFTMVDPFNQVFFDFGGFGRYLPYTLSTENNPTFILYKLAREDKPENAE